MTQDPPPISSDPDNVGEPPPLKGITSVRTTAVLSAAELAEQLVPRTSPVHEQVGEDPHHFVLVNGPFDFYERRLTVGQPDGEGAVEVETVTQFKLAIPVWGWMFRGLFIKALRKPPPPGKDLWWAPPETMDARAARSLSLLCAMGAFAAYLGTLLSQTNTFIRSEFGLNPSEIANALVAVRLGALLALVVMLTADKQGRKRVLVGSLVIACVVTATGAVAPNIAFLGISQGIARAFSATVGGLALIMAAEEMPKNSRAFAVSMLTMAGAVGAGGVVLFLDLADRAPWAWRVFFAVPLLFIVPVLRLARSLTETRRFEVREENRGLEVPPETRPPATPGAESAGSGPASRTASQLRRFVVMALGAFLINLFVVPGSNFLNDFLRDQHGFSGGQISLFQFITTVPGAISIIVGGQLADRFGRRPIGAIGVAGIAVFNVLMFQATGGAIWMMSLLGTLVGALAVPALGTYNAEMSPTGSRGRFGGGVNLVGVLGGVVGLKFAGILAGPEHFGSYTTPMTLLGIGPALLVIVVLLFYPETANRELEDLNPGDAAPPTSPADLAALDADFRLHHPDDA